jgi:MFS family permease
MADPIPSQANVQPSIVLQELSTETEATPLSLPGGGIRRGLKQTFRALRHRNFRLFISGQAISLIGTWMQNVAQAWLVYRLTHSELLLGTVWFCTQIPVFALGSIGGLASDRYSRWKIVILTQTLSLLQALGLALLTLSGRVQVWQVMAFAVMLGCINAFDMPARQSLIIHLTSKDDLLNAISLNSALFNSARVVGPAIAGLVVAAVGEGVCFLLNAISFVAVIACLVSMRMVPFVRTGNDSPWSHLVDGFRFAYRHVEVRAILWMMASTTIAGMPAVVLMPFFADDIFHKGSRGLGFLMGAMGVGAVIGTLVLAGRTKVSGLARVMATSAASSGLCFLIFAGSRWFYFSLLIMPLIGFSTMRQMASANTLIQSLIPDEYRGRIMALYAMTVVGLGPCGSLAAGALAHHYAARVSVAAGGLLYVLAATIFRAKAPAGVC